MSLLYIFLSIYLVPFLFALGLIFFLYGFFEYFIIGKEGDEERSQHGRELFLKSIGWFVVGIIVYLIVFAIGWISSANLSSLFGIPNSNPSGDMDGNAGVQIDRGTGVLQVPNVPTR